LEPRIGGFESARILGKPDELVTFDVPGTSSFIAPEVGQREFGLPADVFSFGMMLFVVLAGLGPDAAWFRQGKDNQRTAARKGDRPKIPSHVDGTLMRKCWDAQPEKRPTFRVVVETMEADAARLPGIDVGAFRRYQARIRPRHW
jgi:serine/threonine protein kinase